MFRTLEEAQRSSFARGMYELEQLIPPFVLQHQGMLQQQWIIQQPPPGPPLSQRLKTAWRTLTANIWRNE